MIECGRAIRLIALDTTSMEEAAGRIVDYLHTNLAANHAEAPDCALVRCFKTHPMQRLPPPLRERAAALLPSPVETASLHVRCLALLASAGEVPAWNSRITSAAHAIIPLPGVQMVERAPMIAQLIRQMGLDIAAVLEPTDELLIEADERAYGVFHVAEAAGSPFIPAQDFVRQFGIRSVLGFGGLLPSGELFALILFSRVFIPRETADLFRTVALSVKLALLPFARGPIFAGEARITAEDRERRGEEHEQLRSEVATLRLLLPALEATALRQTARLESAVCDLRAKAEEVQRLGVRLSSMLESTTDAVFLLDEQWRFTYLNGHARILLKADTDLLGRNLWEEFPAALGRTFWHQYQKVMRERVPVQFEEHYPDPLDRWFEVHAFPSDSGIAVFFHDVTERRQTNDALINSEKLAAVGRLATSIAHEINNPLESVTNLLYLARNAANLTEVQTYLDTADRELRRAAGITSQTLRFHKQSSKPTTINCESLMDDVLSIYQGRLVNSHVHVELRKRAHRNLCCFEGEIRQILNNLVANAIDAMHPTGGRLLLRSRLATDWKTGRRGVALTVADTGPGIPPQTRNKVFDPFFTTKGLSGTGLGLWISREIVARHHGRLLLRSRTAPGHSGTVFSVFLPFDGAAC